MYALVPYLGAGVSTDPCRPRGSDQAGWNAIDLRADGGATPDGGGLNAALLYVPADDPDPQVIKLADDLGETIGPARRTALENRFAVTLRRTTLRGIIWELLLAPHASAWRPLRARHDGRFRFHLGPTVEELRSLSGGSTFAETWTAGDSSSLTADLTWTEFSNADWAIVSNRARITGVASTTWARAEHAVATDDHAVQATLKTFTYSSGTLAAAVAGRKDTTATITAYLIQAVRSAAQEWALKKFVSGTETELDLLATAPAVNDIMKLAINGSQLIGSVNGIEVLLATDTAITGNLYGAIRGTATAAGNIAELDDWSIADLAAAGGAIIHPGMTGGIRG